MKTAFSSKHRRGFTLAELLVSSAIIVMIMGFLFVTVDQTRRTIDSTTSKVAQFQAARVAFDAMTRNLSQATLNTYWDMDYDSKTNNPFRYRRQADLHFVVDKANVLVKRDQTSPSFFPGHGVFFQAPLGVTAEDFNTNAASPSGYRKYRALSNLLSVVGYYVEWGDDPQVPEFIKTQTEINKPKYRFRLMEVAQAAEANMVYNNTNYTTVVGMSVNPASPYPDPRDWIRVATGEKALPTGVAGPNGGKKLNSARPLAENVVALILVPKLSERDRTGNQINDLTGNGSVYDSRPKAAYDVQARTVPAATSRDLNAALSPVQRKQLHQLPPILQVTMVAIDEESGSKLQDQGTNPPNWMDGMFESFTTEAAFQKELGVGDPASIDANSLVYKLSNPERTLPTPRMNYRIFTTDVVLRNSKWSKSVN